MTAVVVHGLEQQRALVMAVSVINDWILRAALLLKSWSERFAIC